MQWLSTFHQFIVTQKTRPFSPLECGASDEVLASSIVEVTHGLFQAYFPWSISLANLGPSEMIFTRLRDVHEIAGRLLQLCSEVHFCKQTPRGRAHGQLTDSAAHRLDRSLKSLTGV
jgi:hypothetical protein